MKLTTNLALQENVQRVLDSFIQDATKIFEKDLLSATLFGSAAQGVLRSTSDVNLIIVLGQFKKDRADLIADSTRLAHSHIGLKVMFILDTEIQRAAETFSVKFLDIKTRHTVLYGKDYFTALKITAPDLITRLRQVLTNLILRLRERYVLFSNREELLSHIIADSAAPLRSAAFSLLKLKKNPIASPKDALLKIVEGSSNSSVWMQTLADMSDARENNIQASKIKNTYFSLIDIAEYLFSEVERIDESI